MALQTGDNMSPIAYEAAVENFDALLEGLGSPPSETMTFESTDAEKLKEMVEECSTGLFLVVLGGSDVDMTKHQNKLYISEPRTDEDGYEYLHTFVIIKTEEDGVNCFQQYPGGMDSEKEMFPVDANFWDDLSRLTSHSRAGVVPGKFQRLFCGSAEPAFLPAHDSMIAKVLAF
mmetsp:Transcript_16259/g.19943  ORF Transcript_16259/g.19943 Transcript_16259/m.19943 type:complete len:174 (-) Transcript_16259:112-633(-)